MKTLAALRRYARAERALMRNNIAEYQAGVRDETPQFHRLNEESADASAAIPAWLWRGMQIIDWWIAVRLNYWKRTGQG